jgi:catechol 2,3-dioxygenase-like lactoylglutathione lyase family enzyme
MPALTGVLETAVYVDDLERARRFYEDVLELKPMLADERLCAYDVAGRSVFLLFRRGSSLTPLPVGNGYIPPHDGQGPLHMAFSIEAGELTAWEQRLASRGVRIESRVIWPRGATSVYFRDPDGHLLELATPGLWPIY